MQNDRLYLHDVIEAADEIANFLRDVDRTSFLLNREKQSAVALQLTVIGEVVRSLPDDLKNRYPDIAWTRARGLRNLIAHRYFAIDWDIIFDTATLAVPILRQQVAAVMAAEFPEE